MPNVATKSVLMERTAPLKYIKESSSEDGKTYLGKLAGIGADFNNPTRNGRRYPLELWRNVENSDDFKEGMATRTIFGENDHPEDRIDTSIKEISIVLTKYEIREDEGIVWTEFDILDTPQGRILKSLLDYGSQIGVSSRGLGDEVVVNGETIIDPDTYTFYAWDAVVMPAVITARPSVVESANRSSLKESFHKEIENASTKAELESIKKIAESTNLPELDSITESINIKLTDLEGNNISDKLENELGNLAQENELLKAKVEKLENQLKANNIRLNETKDLLKSLKSNSRTMSKQLQVEKRFSNQLKEELYVDAYQANLLCEDYDTKLHKANTVISDSKRDIKEAKSKIRKLSRELETRSREYEANIKTLNENIAQLSYRKNTEIAQLQRQLKEAKSNLDNISKQRKLVESKATTNNQQLSQKLTKANEEINDMLEKYIEVKCASYGIAVEALKHSLPKGYTVSDIDNKVSELSAKQDRLNKLPIAIRPVSVKLNENLGLSAEDAQTLRFLKEFNN